MTPVPNPEIFRRLPSVDELLKSAEVSTLIGEHGRTGVVDAIRAELEQLRSTIGQGMLEETELNAALNILPGLVRVRLSHASVNSLRRVINASGVILHTNLGRAPLAPEAITRITECATGYCNLEFDLERGERGSRDEHAQHLFAQLFSREGLRGQSTLVVNNNAAAVLLALAALAQGAEVIVSRGELIEIGGSFRIPEIMQQSGAILREVGTTNRTRVEDYKSALSERTRLLLRVHRSNFEIMGFTEQASLPELAELARQHNIPLMEDLGSGAMVDLRAYGITGEPGIYESLRAGVSLVTFSGDKLLGGPQAGVIAGECSLLERIRKHPLFRAVRVDKMCYAAMEATLSAYVREQFERIPLLQMLKAPPEQIRQRCELLAASAAALSASVQPTSTMIGGGAAPGKSLPSFAVALAHSTMNASELARRLRQQKIPVVARVEEDRVLLDLRTVAPSDDVYLRELLATVAL